MRLLFIGESWRGSCARSLREALSRRTDVAMEEVAEDLFIPKARGRLLRASIRLLAPLHRRELEHAICDRLESFRPDVLMVYKGYHITAELVRRVRQRGVRTVNVYPDCSPHAFGTAHREAIGSYDLVISTKPFHAPQWRSTYGFSNECLFVPQGYDPALHYRGQPPAGQDLDVALVATWRPEYGDLMRELAVMLGDHGLRVGIGGAGWKDNAAGLPGDWRLLGPVTGSAYVESLRRARICIAPVTRHIVVTGASQPGDVDSTRTYELAAAHCFFVHRRTDFVRTLYDELTEVPMFDDAAELSQHVLHFLSEPDQRARMALAAHQRAVPAYSLDQRAGQIVGILGERRQA
jgi:glycosyltransferase involved in cell wall biosynthesis